MSSINSAGMPAHPTADPLGGVPQVPGADGNVSHPHGAPAPVPAQPWAQNPAATNERPNTSPAPVDSRNMPTPR